MKQRPISKDIQPSPDNDPSGGRLALTVKVTLKSLLMAPWFFSTFLLLILFGAICMIYPETRFTALVLLAAAGVILAVRILFRRYREEDGLVVYRDRDDIVIHKKSDIAGKTAFNMSTVKRAWIHQDYTNGALMSSYIILFAPKNGEDSPKRGFFTDRDFESEITLPLPKMHPNILVRDDINLLVLTFVEQAYPHVEIGHVKN